MEAQPLLAEREPPLQIVFAIVVPVIFGVVTGLTLGWSEPVYLVLSLLGILGGLGAGFEHATGGEGFVRGVCGGALFGVFILLAHEVSGADPKAHLPEPQGVLVLVTTVAGALLGALGGTLRGRKHRSETLPA